MISLSLAPSPPSPHCPWFRGNTTLLGSHTSHQFGQYPQAVLVNYLGQLILVGGWGRFCISNDCPGMLILRRELWVLGSGNPGWPNLSPSI